MNGPLSHEIQKCQPRTLLEAIGGLVQILGFQY